jgi:TetR/AcrR family transcriptional repressor of nem operon
MNGCGPRGPEVVYWVRKEITTMARPREFNKEDVLQKAMHLFWQKGYEATSMADLLAATELSKSSLYDTFGDKRKLFLSSLDSYRRFRQAGLQASLNDGRPARESIAAVFESFTSHVLEGQRGYGCMSCNEAVEFGPGDEEVQQIVLADFQAMEDAFAETVARGQRDGSIANREPAQRLARFLTVHMQGLHVMARAGASSEQFADATAVMLSALDATPRPTTVH